MILHPLHLHSSTMIPIVETQCLLLMEIPALPLTESRMHSSVVLRKHLHSEVDSLTLPLLDSTRAHL